jgi:predicted transcriptional regulator
MEVNRLYTVTEIIKEIPECAELTNQRVSALLRQLVDRGEVVRTEDKRKAYFSLPKA